MDDITQDLVQIFTGARALLAKEEGWGKGSYATDNLELDTSPFDPHAVCFCSLGALRRAAWDHCGRTIGDRYERLRDAAENRLTVHVISRPDYVELPAYAKSVPSWQDAEERTREEVLSAFDAVLADLHPHPADPC